MTTNITAPPGWNANPLQIFPKHIILLDSTKGLLAAGWVCASFFGGGRGRGRELPIHSLKRKPNDVLTTCKAIIDRGNSQHFCKMPMSRVINLRHFPPSQNGIGSCQRKRHTKNNNVNESITTVLRFL